MTDNTSVYPDEQRIDAFIAEHRAILNDPDAGTSTLQRIVAATSEEFVALSGEVIEAANRAALAADELADVTNNPSVSVSTVLKEKAYNSELAEHKRMQALSDRLSSFFEEANEVYKAHAAAVG